MTQIFHPSTNALSRFTIFGGVFLVGALGFIADRLSRSSWVTQVDVAVEQPVPFSHKHHAGNLGIDCRYCHFSVEEGRSAGIPPSKTCMTCHSVLFTAAEMLEPVRESFKTDRPIAWTRVHDLPDFVYFDHSIHLAKGIGCVSCHGRVDQMPLMWRENTLNMDWCLECHRDPSPHVRPLDKLFDMDWELPQGEHGGESPSSLHDSLVLPEVHPQQSCSTCHR